MGYGIVCKHCGFMEPQHIEVNKSKSAVCLGEKKEGFSFCLSRCPGYVPIDVEKYRQRKEFYEKPGKIDFGMFA